MTNPKYGPPIAVDGRRPRWLADDDAFCSPGWEDRTSLPRHAIWSSWPKIQLPADHWAYDVIARGFEPWAGGDSAPDDLNIHSTVLRRDKSTLPAAWVNRWKYHGQIDDIIGYTKKRMHVEAPVTTLPTELYERMVAFVQKWETADSVAQDILADIPKHVDPDHKLARQSCIALGFEPDGKKYAVAREAIRRTREMMK